MKLSIFCFLLSLCLTTEPFLTIVTASVRRSRKNLRKQGDEMSYPSVTGKRKERSNSLALDDDHDTSADYLTVLDLETINNSGFTSTDTQSPETVDQLQFIIQVIKTGQYGVLPLMELSPGTVNQLCALRPHEKMKKIEGYTLMHLAAHKDHDEAIMWLAQMGCPTNVYMSRGCTPLQTATIRNNLKATKTLLSLPNTYPHASSVHGRTAFMSAIYNGNLEMIKLFLEAPGMNLSRLLNETDNSGLSVLELAHVGPLEVLENGDINFPEDSSKIYEMAHDKVIEFLLNYSHYMKPDFSFLLRLFQTDRIRFDRLAKEMPQAAISALKTVDINFIHWAVLEENLNLLKALGSATSFDIFGMLPIHFAAENGKYNVIEFYVKNFGVGILYLRSKTGMTVFDYAKGNADLVEYLKLLEVFSDIDLDN